MRILKKILIFATVSSMILAFGTNIMAAEIYSQYTVKGGDTVYSIARAKGLSSDAIVNANGLSKGGSLIYPDMVLLLDSNAKDNVKGNYTVKKGDSLYGIAKAYATTIQTIKADNDLSSDRIYVGQRLYLRQAAAPEYTAPANNGNILHLSSNEIYMMAKMIHAEARGESYRGQVAVGAVIINRIISGSFPNSMSGVLFQKNQFSALNDGQYYLAPNSSALAAAAEAAAGVDPVGGALFYWNPVKAPNNAFLNAKPIIATIGNHVFAK